MVIPFLIRRAFANVGLPLATAFCSFAGAAHVHEIHFPGVRSAEGKPRLHDVAHYTLNALPPAAE